MHWADQNLKSLGDFDAFVSGDSAQTSAAAADSERRMAAALIRGGLAPSDRVLLWMPNGPPLTIAWRAVIRAGGITVVAHHRAPPKRIEQIVSQTSPATIITSRCTDAETGGTTIRQSINSDCSQRVAGWHSMTELIGSEAPLPHPVPRSGSDVASIVHTSGTTGDPRGVVTRHAALTTRMKHLRPPLARLRRTVRHLVVLPMSSAFGSYAFTYGLQQKCTLHFLDEFDPVVVLETIERYRIQQTFLVPAMCEAILALPDAGRYDVTSLRSVVCSGAAVSPELVARFQSALGVRIEIGYGMSGVGMVSRTRIRSNPGSVGRMRPGLKARVVDPNGIPLPSGETGQLVLRLGEGAGVEHWNSDSSVTSVATPGKWYRTGDVVRFDSRGDLHVVGRDDDLIIQGGHNIHGHFVAQVIQRLSGVRECAVVGIPNDYLGQEAVACVALEDSARLTAGDILEHCSLNVDAGSVPASVWFIQSLPRTELGKVRRQELRSAICTSRGMMRDTELLRRLRDSSVAARDALLRSEIQRVLEDVLRTSIGREPVSFRSMGLDSLGSVEVTSALSEAVGRPLPATVTYTYPSIDKLSGFLLDLLDLDPRTKDSAAASRRSPKHLAEEPRLQDYFSSGDLKAAASLVTQPSVAGYSRSILLTGANGFLGRFLALDILDHFAAQGGELHCLVRSPDDSSATERLRNAYASDPRLRERFELLASSNRLNVLAGDLTKPHLGLDDGTYESLSARVDCIIHNGAVVDHMLGYDELYAPNVLGTVEVMRFAVSARQKRISYLSTIAARGFSTSAFANGDAGIAAGYVAGKWASEKLLRELHKAAGVPVRIFRPGYILAHSTYAGQINPRDTLTRLLQGIVTTSLAPESFYESRTTRGAHFDGLPVDVVAGSIAAGSLDWSSSGAEYSEVNFQSRFKDVNLDTITEWVRSAGYRVARVDEYSDWHSQFANRLRSLEDSRRSHSLLPIVHAWERPLRNAESGAPRRRSADVMPAGTPVDEAFIHKCLADMRLLRLIEPNA